MTADFLIIGGGIGGTVLAELLGRGGKKVIVLEKSTGPPKWVRPEILWPATVEVLFKLAPRARWEEEAMLPLQGIEFNDGKQIVRLITPDRLQRAKVQPWVTNPNQTRELLMQLTAFELRRGIEVTSVLKEKNRIVGVRARNSVTGEEDEVLAACIIGDDGVQSVIRKACGIELELRLFPVEFLCFGFDWPSSLPLGVIRAWPNLRDSKSGISFMGAVPIPKAKGIGLVLVRPELFDTNTNLEKSWNRFRCIDPIIEDVIGDKKFPQDFVRIRRPWGHAPRYGADGAILMGDASHPVSPAGGQGANMSVADACVLAELALRNEPNLLADYERRRRPANARSMRPTRVAVFIRHLPKWCPVSQLLWLFVRWQGVHPSLLCRGLHFVSTAFLEQNESR